MYLLITNKIACSSCDQNGVVCDVDGHTQIQTRPDVAAVIALYVNQPIPADVRYSAAIPTIAAIPSWPTETQSQWMAYYNANISPTQINALSVIPADVKALLVKMSAVISGQSQVLLALRDYLFPTMPDGK